MTGAASFVVLAIAPGTRHLGHAPLDAASGKARVVGKRNKERTAFFSDRALAWVGRYLAERTDATDALFVFRHGKAIKRHTAIVWFRWFRPSSSIGKKITAHILRHTVATTLLFNGCPIGHVKEILAHERLQTTCGVLPRSRQARPVEICHRAGCDVRIADRLELSGRNVLDKIGLEANEASKRVALPLALTEPRR